MDEVKALRAKIARYHRTLRTLSHPEITRHLEQLIDAAERRLAEIEREPVV